MEKTNTNPPKKFKYQEKMSNLETQCPPEKCQERETIAYRWVFEQIEDKNNFLPQYLKKPDRFTFKKDKQKCIALGLSFFDTEENAKKRFNQLAGVMGERGYEELGKNIAVGVLKPEHGVCSKPDQRNGHFTFFDYENIELKEHFKIVDAL